MGTDIQGPSGHFWTSLLVTGNQGAGHEAEESIQYPLQPLIKHETDRNWVEDGKQCSSLKEQHVLSKVQMQECM